MTELAGPLGTMPQEPWHPGRDAKLDRVIQLNCGEVHTPANCKATRTWENFNNWRTKVILLLDELWSIANNSKSSANGSKSIIRNNSGLYKCSGIYHLGISKVYFQTFKKSNHEEVLPQKSIFQKTHRPLLKKLQKTKKTIVADPTIKSKKTFLIS